MRLPLLLLPLLAAFGCRRPDLFDVVYPDTWDIRWWPHDEPVITGGEIVLGEARTTVEVRPVPPGAEVRLYASTGGEGEGPCTLPYGVCAGLRDPLVLVDVQTAPVPQGGQEASFVRFRVPPERFPDPGPIAWQAQVLDPDLPGVTTLTMPAIRHVAVAPNDAATVFEDATDDAGLDPLFTQGNTHTGGVAFVDLNGDHFPDLFVANGHERRNYLYRNNGDGTFTGLHDRVDKPPDISECADVKAADVDNDGDIDLIVPVDRPEVMVTSVPQEIGGGPNLLYLNEGGFSFGPDPVAAARDAGLTDPRNQRNSSAAVADYDLDGCIDVYLTQWAMSAEPGADNFDRLVKGNCDGTFTDVSPEMGLDPEGRDGLVGFWWDHDLDRYPELYVGNNSDLDEPPVHDPWDDFWRNRGGAGFDAWTDDPIGYDVWAAMGADVGDLEPDGDWDLYLTDVWFLPPAPHGNALYLGLPGGRLSENRCHDVGVCFGYNSWPTNFEDFDHDGYIDLWVGSSLPGDPDMLFINQADGTGRLVSHRQVGFVGHTSRAGTVADYDGDGDIDIFIFDDSDRSSLWENRLLDPGEAAEGRHWVQILLRGTESNRAAIGALVTTEVGGLPMMRRVTGGDSAHGHRMLTLHFGLGDAEQLDRIEITWPRAPGVSPVQVVENLGANRLWIVDEGIGALEHAFVDPEATFAGGRLTVRTASNYGGRPRILAEGHGALDYDASTVSYAGTFPLDAPPTDVVLTTDYGAPAVIPVRIVADP